MKSIPFASLVGGLSILSGFCLSPTNAQIIPDRSLGEESSTVRIDSPSTNSIEGGAQRGANLFHSFQKFNVDEGLKVYFANPAGIENIFSRVTGNNFSQILGTLGVNGNANLFLINPNGIFFGANAQLDIRGSFVASTAESITFGDRFQFSAINPEAPPLLNIDLTPGLQYGTKRGSIDNKGILTVGENLALEAEKLNLEGQLYAGNHLKLQANDTVKIRDSQTNPFIAYAGNELLISGDLGVDIFTLNHPKSGFFSGGNMLLRSDRNISSDASFWTGGNFRIDRLDGNLGSIISLSDPIIRARGDVSFASYIGASLHILAGGSVNVGSITINGADGANGLQETVTLSDGTTQISIEGKIRPTLDIRAGTKAAGEFPGITGTPSPIGLDLSDTATTADINVGNIDIIQPNGLVFLTNQDRPNDLATGTIEIGRIRTGDNNFGVPTVVFSGDSGDIVIDSRQNINLSSAGIIDSSSLTGSAGDINLIASGDIFLSNNTSILSTVWGGTGDAGDLKIQGRNFEAGASSIVATTTLGMGKGGNLTVDVNESIELIGASNLQAGAASSGNAGSLTINTGKLILLDGSGLITSTFGQGKGGDLTVIAAESVESIGISTQGQHSGFFSTAFGSGNAGNIKVETQKLVLQDGGQIVANSVGQGKSGNVNIHASEAVELIRTPPSAIFATGVFAQSLGGRDAGNLTIDTNILIVREGAFISTGAFKVNPFTGVEVENFQSQAGDLTITASESVLVSGTSGNFRSNINTITEGSGNGGRLTLNTTSLFIKNGANLSTASFGEGKGGNLTINASESIEMIGTKVDSRGFVRSSGLSTNSQGSNDAGNLTISTKKLLIQDGAQASASTFGSGRGGNVFVNASESVEIVGTSSNGEFSSSLNTRTTTVESSGLSGQGDAGNLTIDTKKLILRDGGQVSVSTLSNTGGNAGNLTINASESLEIKGFGIVSSNIISGIFAQALGEKGNGGSINITTGSLLGTDSALIQTQVGRNSEGNGGDINITANTLSLLSGANIDGSTFGRGNAGSIRLNAANSILLDGVDTDNFSSGVYSRVGSRAEGKGGSIFLNTSKIAIQNAARVAVDSQGEGEGGNINLQADSLTQNSGNISAEAASNMGGNITLQVRNLLSLENNSQISTTAGTAQASGNGGNIAIDAQFIVATPNQNNNITANAFQGRGGNINITTQGIFGIQLNQTDNLLTNDITASSDFGIDGTVSFNTPEVDPASGLVELPSTIVDADALIAKDICAFKDDKIAGGSSFVITGKGGLPPNADDPLVNSYRIVEWVTRTEEGDNTIDKPTFNNPIKTDEPANIPSIEEAQGWIINPDGKITLVAVAVNATPQSFGLVHPQCR